MWWMVKFIDIERQYLEKKTYTIYLLIWIIKSLYYRTIFDLSINLFIESNYYTHRTYFFYQMRFFWILLLVILDLLTKFLFYDLRLLPEIFTPILNPGVSFSIAIHLDIVVFVSTALVVAIIWLWKKNQIRCFESVLILSGAFWNLFDRISSYQWVRDFIWLWVWPVFNLADIFLTIWVIYILYFQLIKNKEYQKLSN